VSKLKQVNQSGYNKGYLAGKRDSAERIAELEAERNQVKCEVGVWLDGDQTPLKTLLNIQTILNVL